jgi:8-oxo-dGTP pyrophosphatase MutT (NUDIX family)
MKDKPSLAQYKKTLTTPLRQATLCFLIKDNQVLLAMKKRGYAQGKWNGVGGKMAKDDKDIKETAIRETKEEIGITPTSLILIAVLNFYHLGNQDEGQQVTVYLSNKWVGDPSESDEMAPKWFELDKLPYEEMWEDDKFWLPKVLRGERVEADFLFDENQILLDQNMRELEGGEK